MNEHMTDLFDEETYVDEHIRPLVRQIYELCNERNIPFICALATSNHEDRVGINITAALPGITRTPLQLAACRYALNNPEESEKWLRDRLAKEAEGTGLCH